MAADPTVLSISTDDPPVVTALAPGSTTLYSGEVAIPVTVFAGTSLPAGAPIWTIQIPGNDGDPLNIVPAVPSSTGADVFAFRSGTLTALSSDGFTAWTTSGLPYGTQVIPDFSGNAVLKEPLTYIDSQGAQHSTHILQQAIPGQVPATVYTFTEQQSAGNYYSDSGLSQAAIPDTTGTLFVLDNNQVTLINQSTGRPFANVTGHLSTASIQNVGATSPTVTSSLPQLRQMIVAGDGNAYLSYAYDNTSWTNYSDLPGNFATHDDHHEMVLRISPDGTSANTEVATSTVDETCVSPDGSTIHCTTSGPVMQPNAVSLITNADQGVAVFLNGGYGPCAESDYEGGVPINSGCGDGMVHLNLAYVSHDTLTSQVSDAMVTPAGTPAFTPSLQRVDGSYIGTNGTSVATISLSGTPLWSTNFGVPVSAEYATDDGGAMVTTTTSTQLGTAFHLDSQGNVSTQNADSGTQLAWTGTAYSVAGQLLQSFSPSANVANTFWAFGDAPAAQKQGKNTGANASGTSVATIQETLYMRSFAPWPAFGPEAVPPCPADCFQGDNRSFTTSVDPSVTSRITSITYFVLPGMVGLHSKVYSDQSHDLFWNRTATQKKDTVDFWNNGFDALHVEFAGANPLTPSPDINTKLDMSDNPSQGLECYNGHLYGDAFPNSEVFIINSKQVATMLVTYATDADRNLGPAQRLPGDNNNRDMGSFVKCVSK